MPNNINSEEIRKRINKIREDKGRKPDTRFIKSLSLVTSLGVTMVISVFLGMGLGIFMVKEFNNDLFLPLGLFIGVALGGYLIYALIKQLIK